MYFVDRDRRVGRLAPRPLRTPCVVRPAERRGIVDDRCGGGRRLDPPGDRIGLHRQQRAVRSEQLVLVERAGREPWDENLPHSRLVAQSHRVASPVPGVEVADDGNAPRIRRPHGEAHPRHPVDHHCMRAKAGSEVVVLAFGQQVDVEFAEQWPEGIGVLGLLDRPAPVDAQQIGARAGGGSDEQAGLAHRAQRRLRRSRSSRATTVTANAPGSMTRTMSPDGVDAGRAPRRDRGCALR